MPPMTFPTRSSARIASAFLLLLFASANVFAQGDPSHEGNKGKPLISIHLPWGKKKAADTEAASAESKDASETEKSASEKTAPEKTASEKSASEKVAATAPKTEAKAEPKVAVKEAKPAAKDVKAAAKVESKVEAKPATKVATKAETKTAKADAKVASKKSVADQMGFSHPKTGDTMGQSATVGETHFGALNPQPEDKAASAKTGNEKTVGGDHPVDPDEREPETK